MAAVEEPCSRAYRALVQTQPKRTNVNFSSSHIKMLQKSKIEPLIFIEAQIENYSYGREVQAAKDESETTREKLILVLRHRRHHSP